MKVLFKVRLTLLLTLLTVCSFGQVDNCDIIFNLNDGNVKQLRHKIDTTLEKFIPTLDEALTSKKISLAYFDSLFSADKHTRSKEIRENFNGYCRQYVGYINDKGHRIIYINCFCKAGFRNDFDPKERWEHVYDGGHCYYQIRVDLVTHKSFGLFINGSS